MNLKSHFLNNDFSYKFSFTINEILQDWSSIQNTNTYLTAEYLTALEKGKVQHVNFIYVVIYKQQIPVGLLYLQCLKITNGFYFQETFPHEINKKITTKMLQNLCGNLWVCGNFFATGVNGFLLNKEVTNDVVQQVLKSLKAIIKKNHHPLAPTFIMFKEFWENQEVNIQTYLQEKYTAFEIDVNMVLCLTDKWKSFQDYLESMTTKYRSRAKSVYKKTSDIQERQLTAEEINKYKFEIKSLYLSVVNTASFNMLKLTEESFYQFKKELKDNFVFTAYFLEDKMVAFSTCCFTNNCLDANYVGIDYAINESMPLYQRVLYDYVKLAIKNNVKELRLGRTAEIMKSSLGAKPEPMILYLKQTHKVIHTLIKPLIKSVKPNTYELRNPFKVDVKA